MSAVDEIKSRIDIVDLISEYVPLKKAGRNYKALCPFHTEDTPSFIVFPESGTWHCFGACGTGGDIFTFIMKRENMDFGEALRFLARRAGVELAPRTPAQVAEEEKKERLRQIHTAAALYYHDKLLHSPEGQSARAYLEKRAIGAEMVERFQLGYAPAAWRNVSTYLMQKGYRRAELEQAGLIIVKEEGSYYDRFRGRLMIPIRDGRGQVIAFGGRALDDSEAKYINSPKTPLFNKSHVLFGLDLARESIRASGQAVVVEGYMDVIQAHQHGASNVVASMGTALTEAQVRLLKRFARIIILALDADTAGQKATLRGLDLSRQIMLHEIVKIGPALVESQYSSEADVRIAVLPAGKDPDEVLRADPGQWARLIAEAQPIIDYYFRLVKSELDPTSPQSKSQAVKQLLPIIADLEDSVQRAHYLQKLARLVQVEEKTLAEALRRQRRRKRSPAEEWQTARPLTAKSPLWGLEEHCLSLLLEQGDLLAQANELLSRLAAPELGESDFADTQNRQIFLALRERLASSQDWNLEEFQAALGPDLQEHLAFLLEWPKSAPTVPEELQRKDALNSLLRLRESALQRKLKGVYFLQEDAQEQGDEEAIARYGQVVDSCTRELRGVQHLLDMRSLSGRRRAEKERALILSAE